MANIEHSVITDSNCHEPKHITALTTTDSGKVITPSSSVAGTSEIRLLTMDDFDQSASDHISTEIIANSTTIALGTPTDSTLHTSADYADITLFTLNTANAKNGFTFAPITGEITVTTAGTYRGEFWASVSSDTVTTVVGTRYALNGNYFANGSAPVPKVLASVAGDIHMISGSAELPLAVNDIIKIGIVADKACALTIHEAGLILRRVE